MIGEIVNTVSSASTQLEASAGTLTATAERAQELTTMVAAASEEASTNVQSWPRRPKKCFIGQRDQPSGAGFGADGREAVGEARKTNDRVSELSKPRPASAMSSS